MGVSVLTHFCTTTFINNSTGRWGNGCGCCRGHVEGEGFFFLSFLLSLVSFFVYFYFIQTETFWEIETITKRILSQLFERRLFQDHEEGDMR